MPANRIGPSRAIVQRSYRRGYARAVADAIAVLSRHIPPQTFGRLKGWQRKVAKWRDKINVACDEAAECEPAPLPIFTRRQLTD